MPPQTTLYRHLRTHQIYGANTSIGKTILTTLLLKSHPRDKSKTHYLKPISTGPQNEADDSHISRFAPHVKTKCLFQYKEAVSPHLAVKDIHPNEVPSDQLVVDKVQEYVSSLSTPGTLFLETAGGVHSPMPSGTSQADAYRQLRYPVTLIADSRLGGISSSISAFESLHLRGYDLDAVCIFRDEQYQNYVYLREYFKRKGVPMLAIPKPPEIVEDEVEDRERMGEYYDTVSQSEDVLEIVDVLRENHEKRVKNLQGMAERAYKSIWYPFTQHRDVSPQTILTIDSASGDFFQAHPTEVTGEEKQTKILQPTFDGSASWWTQGLGHGNPELSLAASYAAGRYGHVMFAGTIHQPALELAENLIKNLENPRLQKCFFSDNGSTGMEVATKMAFTASFERYKWNIPKHEVGVIGLKGSYHGDTIGAMDASEPSTYNEKVHWYQGRGYWFDFPQIKMVNGEWVILPPDELKSAQKQNTKFASLKEVFDLKKRESSPEYQVYRQHIEETLNRLVKEEGKTFGALVMEPVILGAGGMLSVDPLFQHLLVSVIRQSSHIFASASSPSTPNNADTQPWTGLPVVFDEVFTGLYRLGRFSAASLIQVHPDISVHAKLLTGGLVPLCTTLASDSIYEAFLGKEKRDALLHGHSYTAHPVGCHVANTSIKKMMEMNDDGSWKDFKEDWAGRGVGTADAKTEMRQGDGGIEPIWSMWSHDFITWASIQPKVDSVFALGSVLAIHLRDEEHAGYNSSAATGLQKQLLRGNEDIKIHSRVLGNVFYLMASQVTSKKTLRGIEKVLRRELGKSVV